MTEFDLSAAVDDFFASAKPGEILRNWNEWGCGRYAQAGVPFFEGTSKTELLCLRYTEASDFIERVRLRSEIAHPHAAAVWAQRVCLVLDFDSSAHRMSANSELALAA